MKFVSFVDEKLFTVLTSKEGTELYRVYISR